MVLFQDQDERTIQAQQIVDQQAQDALRVDLCAVLDDFQSGLAGSYYNIGNLLRTVNLPVLALSILEPRQQSRFVFKRIGKGGDAPVRSAAAAATTVWVIGYREVEGQTMIRTTNFRDLPARGRFWIEPDSGQVLASELIAQDLTLTGVITVGYEREPALNVLVPIQMKERYDLRRGPSPVTGEANYRSFRQFQVKVDEKIAPIVKE